MKNKLILLFVLFFLFNYSVLCQYSPVMPAESVRDNTENITADDLRKLPKRFYQFNESVKNILEPSLTQINFDDIIFNQIDSIIISPNRYANVRFYSPYYNDQTYLTWHQSISYPNSLVTGYDVYNPQTNGYDVYSRERMIVEFTHKSKDVSFIWGTNYGYSIGWIDIYDVNNQLITTITVNFGGYLWIYIPPLNQYSQNIKKLILRRPTNADSRWGHIFLDNFQFTPNPSNSPIGTLESVSIQQGVALGWSADPDNQSASNFVDCYVNSNMPANFIGRVTANLPGTGSPYSGNHRFSIPIPIQYRDGNQHNLYCYGIDITGDDQSTLLSGSPMSFRFNSPIGSIGSISSLSENELSSNSGIVDGWSLDADLPEQSNIVRFYIDGPIGTGTFAGETSASLPRPDVNQQTGYPGNHGYEFTIPNQYRNGVQHTIYAYGIDLTGDSPSLLQGSPKTFRLDPKVQTITFQEINSPLSANNVNDNPNLSIGKRIFPDRMDSNDTVNRRIVEVKATTIPAQANTEIFFKSFDLDDPSANTAPVDDDSGRNADAEDNRGSVGGSKAGQLTLSTGTTACATTPPAGMFCSKTNSSGVALVDFTVTMNPGDNFAIAASSDQNYLNGIRMTGINLQDSTAQEISIGTNQGNAKAIRTEMLTVWRKIHLEIDSMGTVQNNFWEGNFTSNVKVKKGQNQILQLPTPLPPNESPEKGVIIIEGQSPMTIEVYNQPLNQLLVNNTQGSFKISASPQNPVPYKIYDDDDFDGDESQPGKTKNGDTGDDVRELTNTFKLVKDADGMDSQTGEPKNVFAPAYIRPNYTWAESKTTPTGKPYNDTNVSFDINVEDSEVDCIIEGGINNCPPNAPPPISPRDSDADEKDDFWVSYLLISYQGPTTYDIDSIFESPQNGIASGGAFADCLNSSVCPSLDPTDPNRAPYRATTTIPTGSNGALIFIETIRDYVSIWTAQAREERLTAPHELGHLFGVRGDREGTLWKIMGYPRYHLTPPENSSVEFHPEHIKILRSRIKSPGKY